MFERFTDRARKTMALANQEAQRFNHEYIGTEHILLGLLKEGGGRACTILSAVKIDLRQARLEIEKLVKAGPDMVTMGKLPQTPRAKKVIEYAMEEARNLNHNHVGTEHLLLGLLREQDGIGAQVLVTLGAKLDDIRQRVLVELGFDLNVENQSMLQDPPQARFVRSLKVLNETFDFVGLDLSALDERSARAGYMVEPEIADFVGMKVVAVDVDNFPSLCHDEICLGSGKSIVLQVYQRCSGCGKVQRRNIEIAGRTAIRLAREIFKIFPMAKPSSETSETSET